MTLKRVRTFLAASLATWSSACAVIPPDSRIGSKLSPSDPDYPLENQSPKRIVEVFGRVPAAVRLELFAGYATSNKPGCLYTGTLWSASGPAPIGLATQLVISRSEESYTTTFAIDRFHPGRCEWKFLGV